MPVSALRDGVFCLNFFRVGSAGRLVIEDAAAGFAREDLCAGTHDVAELWPQKYVAGEATLGVSARHRDADPRLEYSLVGSQDVGGNL